MIENAQIMDINDVLFLLTIPKQDQELSPCSCSRLAGQGQGPCPGQVFSYSNRTKNTIPDLAIAGSFMEFPGSLHPLIIFFVFIKRKLRYWYAEFKIFFNKTKTQLGFNNIVSNDKKLNPSELGKNVTSNQIKTRKFFTLYKPPKLTLA